MPTGDKRSFALKKNVEDFAGASTTAGGNFINIGELLEKGKGVITTSDETETAAYRQLEVLKEVSDSEAAEVRKAPKKSSGRVAGAKPSAPADSISGSPTAREEK